MEAIGEDENAEIVDNEKAKGMLRLKKFVASKLGYPNLYYPLNVIMLTRESSAGQKIIRNIAGVHGTNMLTAVFNMMVKYSGINEAKAMRVHIYKLAGKLSVFLQNHTLRKEMLLECRESCILLVSYVLEQLQLALRLRDTSLFSEVLSEAYRKVNTLLRSSVKTTGCAVRLTSLYDYVLSGFGEYLLTSADALVEQEVLCNSIRHLMSPFENEVQHIKTHMKEQLYAKRSALASLVSSPSLHSYLTSLYASHLLSDFYLEKGGIDYMHRISFHNAVCEYRSISSRTLVASRAQLIRDVYLIPSGERYVSIPKIIFDDIDKSIDAEIYSRTLFDKALNFMLGPLDSVFASEFLQCPLFKLLQDDLERVSQKISVWFHEDPAALLDMNDEEPTLAQRLTFWK